jgi:hypothetical protein
METTLNGSENKMTLRKYKELHPNLDYTIFYDEYYEYSEYNN